MVENVLWKLNQGMMGRAAPGAFSVQVVQGCRFLVDFSVIRWKLAPAKSTLIEAAVILNLVSKVLSPAGVLWILFIQL